ncbi:MAG TPA: UvrD-helicase domain-containing protein, partial [Thermoanaerobaculia bacterium]|nr:UvrD-helicase domain-containing protein [Thermoanaerobaculia bacterium]
MTSPRDLELADRQARKAALTEFDHPLVIEAGAGTGKTTTLVGRLLSWCLGRGWDLAEQGEHDPSDRDSPARAVLSGVVAITFTEQAAAEMLARSTGWLTRVAAGDDREIKGFDRSAIGVPSPEEEKERARALLAHVDLLTVRTIHSFCHSLLRQYPFAAGIHPHLEVDADGYHLERQVFEQIESSFPRLIHHRPDDLAILAEAGIGPRALAEGARELIEKGVPEGALSKAWFTDERIHALTVRSAEVIAKLAAAARPLTGLSGKNKASGAAVDALEAASDSLMGATSESSTQERLSVLKDVADRLAEARSKRIAAWSKGSFNTGERQTLEPGMDSTLGDAASAAVPLIDHLNRLEPERFRAIREALAPAVAGVTRELRARGVATYHDLLVGAVRLLRSESLAARVRAGMQQLLVDEVQDTDPLQFEILSRLALQGERRPGLFVVGDPKQSIYAWRRADLAAYDAFKEAILAAGGRVMELSRNFRSAPQILAEVTRALAPVMLSEPGVQPPFSELLASPDTVVRSLPGERRAVEFWISWPYDHEKGFHHGRPLSDLAARIEARAIANDLFDLHHEHEIDWKTCGILLRSRNHFEIYLQALRERGIPFVVSRDKLYYQRREVIDAAALVRLIVDPADELALVTWLRSPLVGVPDAALLPLWAEDFPVSAQRLGEVDGMSGLRELIERAHSAIDPAVAPQGDLGTWNQHLEHACRQLASLRKAFECEPADRFIERLRLTTQIEATAAARFQGRHRLANLDRLFHRLETALEENGGDSQRLLRELRRGVAEAQEEEEARLTSEESAVSVLTIHGAKGLEFDYLYAANLDTGTRPATSRGWDVEWLAGSSACELLLHGAPSPQWNRIESRRQESSDAERVRTLYVALTRAAQRLVLLGGWHRGGAPKMIEDPAGDHLSLLARRRGKIPDLLSTWQRLEAKGESNFVDEDGVRWVFPELDPLLRSPEITAPEWGESPSPKRVREESLQLAEERNVAAIRMARPFAGSPSHFASRSSGTAEEPGITSLGRDDEARTRAALVGTRIHHLFESWDLSAPPDEELERRRLVLLERLEDEDEATARAANEILDRLASGTLWRRFAALGGRALARELPMLLPGKEEGDGPLGYLSGKIDLIYRGGDDTLVVADYKTDRVEGDEA